MPLDLLDFGLKLAGFLLSFGAIIYTWFATRSKKVDGLEDRVQKIEAQVATMPGRDEVHDIMIKLTEMRGDLREIHALMGTQQTLLARVDDVVSRHEEFLMNGGK